MTSLAQAIIAENIPLVKQWLQHTKDLNELDEYGFTYLIEAAIVNNLEIASLICQRGANVNQQDVNGNTALHWAVENNNIALCQLLLSHNANPNAYNIAGQPILVMPLLRHQKHLQRLLYQAGASQEFASDFINVKILGHIFDLVGVVNIVSPSYEFVEVDFEGFYLEITLNLIGESLLSFKNNYAARSLKNFSQVTQEIVNILHRSALLSKYRQYQVDVRQHLKNIQPLLQQEPLLLAIGYEGHAISFIKTGNIFIKCDRRISDNNPDTVTFFKMLNPQACNLQFMLHLLYDKHNSHFINDELPNILQLQSLINLPLTAQISGNCSWANIEACIPSLFLLLLHGLSKNTSHNQELAMNFFQQWRNWSQTRNLDVCWQSFVKDKEPLRQASKAEILAAVLFQRYNDNQPQHTAVITKILSVLRDSPYKYILDNYLKIYYYQSATPEGANFAQLLKSHQILK
jgi:hypothetical protein